MVTRAQLLYYNHVLSWKHWFQTRDTSAPQGTAGYHNSGRSDSVSGIQCLQAKDMVQHPMTQRRTCRPQDYRAENVTGARGERACEGGTGDIPWPPSYTLRRQSSPVSSFSLACALSHFPWLELEHGLTFLPLIFSKLHPAGQHRHNCTAQRFFLQANPKHHDVYLTLTNVCFINGSEFGDLPGKDKGNLTVHSTELRTCAWSKPLAASNYHMGQANHI